MLTNELEDELSSQLEKALYTDDPFAKVSLITQQEHENRKKFLQEKKI